MAQIFSERATTVARVALVALVIGPIGFFVLIAAYVRSDYVTGVGYDLTQPVPFSHEHHVGEYGLDCRYCHTSVEKSFYAGMPPTEICMTCHSQIWTNAKMLAPVRRSLAEGIPIHWQRINDLPDYVYFDHAVHINNGIGCTTCHGQVDSMPLMHKAETLYMSWCLACHRDPIPHLRPPDKIFATDWKPPPDQEQQGRRLAKFYQLHIAHLTDCSVCHR